MNRTRAENALARARADLKHSDALLHKILSSLDEAVLLINPHTSEIDDCNSRAEAMFGRTREEMVGSHTSILYVNDHTQEQFSPESADAHSREGVYVNEFLMKRKSGEVFPTQLFITHIHDGQGEISRLLGVVRDITEKQRSEHALRENERLFRTIFETVRECIFVKDRSLRYTLVNPAMQDLLGLDEACIIGRTDKEIFGYKAAEHLAEVDARVLNGEFIEQEHTRPVRGQPATFLDIRSPLLDGSGEVAGIVGVSRDISDRTRIRPGRRPVVTDQYPSKAMAETLHYARLAARTESTVMLTGESGSGKDHLATFIHQHSRRSGGLYFSVNCAAVPEELAESELFGHEAGAFTGARQGKRGLLELAEGGTLLLNEIGELPLALQGKLLTFLDTRTFTRVGGVKQVRVNARLLVATNRNLAEEVKQGAFRHDLYYRVNVFSIRVPPLRDRSEDIPGLVGEILADLVSARQLPGIPGVEDQAIDALKAYSWPGNIRELRNVLERALIVSQGGPLGVRDLGLGIVNRPCSKTVIPDGLSLNEYVWEMKLRLVRRAMEKSRGNKSVAAKLLGISRSSVISYLKIIENTSDGYSGPLK